MTSPSSPSASPGPLAPSPPSEPTSSSELPQPSNQCFESSEAGCLESDSSILSALEELHQHRALRIIALQALAELQEWRRKGHQAGCQCQPCVRLRADCCRGGLWREVQ